jgi:tRNA pseudouridine55 synthase
LGYETTTLDAAGTIVKQMPWDHVTMDSIQAVLPSFRGTIQQVPPAFSAIRKGGKRMYEEARQGKTQADLQIQARPVEVYHLELIQPLPQQQQHDNDEAVVALPKFQLQVECGGGTYIRSLVRDIGIQLGTVATTIQLERTQQAQFTLDDALKKDDWTADNIYHAIEKCNDRFGDSSNNNK